MEGLMPNAAPGALQVPIIKPVLSAIIQVAR
jgi:hypothetical protein